MTVANDEETVMWLSLPAEPLSVPRARHAVTDFAAEQGARSEDIALAVSEAVSNAVIHAFGDRAQGTVDIEVRAIPEALVIRVSDDGHGVTPNPDSPGLGFGLALIGSLAEGVELSRDGSGTTIVMRFALAA